MVCVLDRARTCFGVENGFARRAEVKRHVKTIPIRTTAKSGRRKADASISATRFNQRKQIGVRKVVPRSLKLVEIFGPHIGNPKTGNEFRFGKAVMSCHNRNMQSSESSKTFGMTLCEILKLYFCEGIGAIVFNRKSK